MKKFAIRRVVGLSAALLTLSPFVVTSPLGASSPRSVNVVGYSVVSGAFSALEKGFQATRAGKGVTFTNSFGASTAQAEDVLAGEPADVAVFSDVPDLNLLVAAGLVSKRWANYGAGSEVKGFVTDSVVVIVTRAGNPLGITGWNSLTQRGVQIVTADPLSSGSARWNLLAAYESQIQRGESATQAKRYTNSLVAHVVSEPSSASKALTTFESGTGNVVLAYESDALAAKAAGQAISIVDPAHNTLIQNPAALTTSGLSNPSAVAFYNYLFSRAGQTTWVAQNLRGTIPYVATLKARVFYAPARLATVGSLGGWGKVIDTFFSPSGVITKIEKAHGYTN